MLKNQLAYDSAVNVYVCFSFWIFQRVIMTNDALRVFLDGGYIKVRECGWGNLFCG